MHIGTLTGGNATAQEQLRLSGDYTATNSGALLRFTNQHNAGTNPNAGEYNLAGIKAFDFRSDWGGAIALQTAPNTSYGGTLVDRLVINPEGLVGIGTSIPTAPLHVFKGESGGAANNTDSSLVLENSSHTYINFLTPASKEAGILWGDDASANTGMITYSHVTDNMSITAADDIILNADKVSVAGNIEMTAGAANVNGRRIFMGGISGTTFGLAYDSDNPNYGIFYTEGSPDAVNISPNGSATAGVMTILGNGNVGIGQAAAASRLEIKDNASNNYSTEMRFSQGYSTSVYSTIGSNFGGAMSINAGQGSTTANLNFNLNGQLQMKIDVSGRVTTPGQPAFRARAKTGQVYGSGWQQVLYDEAVTTRGTGYASSRFTAPVDGWYQFNAQWTATNNSDADGTFSLWINNSASNLAASVSMPNTGGSYDGHSISGCCYLAATHYVTVHRYSTVSTTTRTSNPYGGWFSGFLIG